MKLRSAILFAAAIIAAAGTVPAATAADLTDVGFIDQAEFANLPAFSGANSQLAAYKSRLEAQYNSAVKRLNTDADRQRLSMQFQQQLNDKQRELVGPLYQRAQLAIASVAATRSLSIVVDKRIVIYGGQDVTKDAETLFLSPQAINPVTASPPPSEIGFVDQNALDSLPKVQAANDQMAQFAATQRQLYSGKIAQARSNSDKQQIFQQYNKSLSDKQEQLLKPLVDQTKNVTAEVARKKSLLLVIDRADVIYGGTDITTDVQNELSK